MFPQITRVVKDTEGAKAISYSTWCVWISDNYKPNRDRKKRLKSVLPSTLCFPTASIGPSTASACSRSA